MSNTTVNSNNTSLLRSMALCLSRPG